MMKRSNVLALLQQNLFVQKPSANPTTVPPLIHKQVQLDDDQTIYADQIKQLKASMINDYAGVKPSATQHPED